MNEENLQCVAQLLRNVEEGMTCEDDVNTLRYLLDLLDIEEQIQTKVDRSDCEEL